MNKLQEIKQRAKELMSLVDAYEDELFHEAVKIGQRSVYDKVCGAFAEETKKHQDINGKHIKDIPSAERILNASGVIIELFPELNN